MVYRGNMSSMHERLHYTTFWESTMNDSSDTPSASKQVGLKVLFVALHVLRPILKLYKLCSRCYHQRFKANKFSRWGMISEPHEL